MAITVNTVDTSVKTIYTSVDDTVVTFFSITNTGTTAVTVDVYVVPSDINDFSTIAESAIVLSNLEITVDDTYQFFVGGEKLLLGDGDEIQIQASDTGAINTCISYTEV